jgi:hypothetical protein
MTNHDISHVLASIGEAKRALDAEPLYVRTISALEKHVRELGETVAQRELRIHELKAEVATVTQALRSAEVERDDAGFRHLEEADKVQALLTLVRQHIADSLLCVGAIEGKQQIVVNREDHDAAQEELQNLRLDFDNELERNAKLERQYAESEGRLMTLQAVMMETKGEHPVRPFPGSVDMGSTQSKEGSKWDEGAGRITDWPSSLSPAKDEDKRVADPIPVSASGLTPQALGDAEPHATVTEGQSDGPFAPTVSTEPQSASSPIADTSTDAPSPASPPERNRDPATRYAGRKYYDVTYYVSLHAWLEGDGTEADYNWRPETSRASHYSS